MDRADALAACNRSLLRAFSRQTTERLNDRLPVRMALSWLEHFLAQNVAKEVRKDSLVIRRAGAALASAGQPGAEAVRELLAATHEIDKAFLRNVAGIPVGIVIRHDEIEPIRRQRIERLLQVAYHVLQSGQTAPNLRSALQGAYPRAELERLIQDLMRLYAQETRALSRSLHMPMLLAPLRDRLTRTLYEVMTEAAVALARQAAAAVYRRTPAQGDSVRLK